MAMHGERTDGGCRRYEELLSAYLDDELSPVELREIGAHLKVCPRCSGTLEELIGLKGLLQGADPYWDRPVPAEGFRAAVMARVDAPRLGHPSRWARRHPGPVTRLGVMAAAVFLLIGIVTGVFMGYRQSRLASVPGPQATGEVMLADVSPGEARVEDYILEHAMESSPNLLLGYEDTAEFVNYVDYREP